MKFENGYSVPKRLKNATERKLFGENYMISEVFGFDGRGEDYEHVFEWSDLTDTIWQDGAYSIRGCVEFEPDCVLLLDDGNPVGFYMGGQAWIDPEHRGRGHGARTVVACIAMSGTLPPVKDIGFSEAGFAAHMGALEIMREMIPMPTASC